MVAFDKPLLLKKSSEDTNVILGDKSPKQKKEDLSNGISRFGGSWRSPSYLNSYLLSSNILLEQGLQKDCLDDIGLPLFYLQRHTTELLIKRLLSWIYEIGDMRVELKLENHGVPSSKERRLFETGHTLNKLLNDLTKNLKMFDFKEPPDELVAIVNKITTHEKTETWARYDKSRKKEGEVLKVIKHVESEISIPIVEIQQLLSTSIAKIVFRFGENGSYEEALHDEWLNLARLSGHVG